MFAVTEINDGAKLKFEMRNESGELESSFTFNPYDLYFMKKVQKIENLIKNNLDRNMSRDDWTALNEALAYLVSDVLGGGQEGSIFRKYAPTERLPDGQIFVVAILDETLKAALDYLSIRKERFANSYPEAKSD